ncbi:MAG TPA: hypothetical protein PKV84_07905, partial [Candidatus Omnitrophota bacterium]|nr:hypothetical protein [Candidatus Omnitrophota bacterium]
MRNRLWRKGIWFILPALFFFCPLSAFADDPGAVAGASDALATEGKTGEALAPLNRSLGQSPSDPVLLAAKANVLLRTRAYEETTNICRQIIAKDPNYDWPVKILVRSLLDQKRYQEALKELAQAESFLKEDYTLAILEGEALQGLRKYQEAAEAFDRAALMKPDDVGLYEIKAWNLRLMGKIHDSEKELQKALALQPYNQRLLVVMANHYRERRYYRKSLDYLREAIKACGQSSCPEIDQVFSKDFFYGTGISGLQLFGGGGFGVSSAIRDEYTGEFSNVENILRGLRSQNANAAEEDTLAVPRMTPQNIFQSVTHIRLPKFPLIHFYSNYNQRFNKKDTSIEHLNHEYRLELEETLRIPRIGDVTFFPYYKYLYTRGANFEVQELLGSDFKINVHSFGLRNLFVPVFGKYLIETEYSFGLGYYCAASASIGHGGVKSSLQF